MPSSSDVDARTKHQWLIDQYDALFPDGQAAVDAALLALPHRPEAAAAVPPPTATHSPSPIMLFDRRQSSR